MSNLPGEQEVLGAGPGRPAGKAQVDEKVGDMTYADVAKHNEKTDLYLVIHDKVYDASKFVDEHPLV